MLVRVWQELDYRIDVGGHMEHLSETLRDTLSSVIHLSSMSAMVTHLQTHKALEGHLTCSVLRMKITDSITILLLSLRKSDRVADKHSVNVKECCYTRCPQNTKVSCP